MKTEKKIDDRWFRAFLIALVITFGIWLMTLEFFLNILGAMIVIWCFTLILKAVDELT